MIEWHAKRTIDVTDCATYRILRSKCGNYQVVQWDHHTPPPDGYARQYLACFVDGRKRVIIGRHRAKRPAMETCERHAKGLPPRRVRRRRLKLSAVAH